jgi:hypothetical protein
VARRAVLQRDELPQSLNRNEGRIFKALQAGG